MTSPTNSAIAAADALQSIQDHCRNWEPQVRLLGNIEAQEIDAAIDWVRSELRQALAKLAEAESDRDKARESLSTYMKSVEDQEAACRAAGVDFTEVRKALNQCLSEDATFGLLVEIMRRSVSVMVEDIESRLAQSEALLREAHWIVAAYAADHPKHTTCGAVQDPMGAHELSERIDNHFAPKETT